MGELHHISATEALRAFRTRQLSPVELTEAVIARAERTEPVVNALGHRFFDEALRQAERAERRYAGEDGPPRPLEGLPTVVKEDEPVAGQPWTQGSLNHRDLVATHTSVYARRLIDAGAIVHARSTASEFATAAFTHSALWGVTRNPWNPDVSPGGSSGGSAAALAAGSTVLASGSDTAGSIRVPASFTGVVGFKPPHGRVPVDPPFHLDGYVHSGVLARTVADAALLQNVVAGPHAGDVGSLRPRYVLPDPAGRGDGLEGVRIGLSEDLGDWAVDPEVRRNTRRFAERLRAAGATVEEVELHVPRAQVMRAAAIHFHHGFAGAVAAEGRRPGARLTPYAKAFVRWAATASAGATVLDGLAIESDLHAPVGALFERFDALVCPTAATRGLVAGEDYVDHGPEVDGERLGHYLESLLALPFNIMNRCPVLAVPSGFARNGVPTGVQIVGRPFDDATPFRIGSAVEQQQDWPEVALPRTTAQPGATGAPA
ncbi:amidase [Pseudonocardia kunmingensis]|uniref:Amidase/aspartyl-tRNA(Asn)/glutamyl-tRNA(Gln) amidotransferase subunit A n=1 Tax=Pseudonocardia kunmingensis TaxID=630975 RepID=A0A543E2T4_9PSEU|nr:amidase [Pseudonocardia kunmingensis]TQM15901.1 amidase/aspartyl-tRNA(Asn)/glutamyl-tRNA(Gln) amidotransferase subunit A [Pseudonocardia kunmingensis]